jgi:hypothetical protein
MEQPKGQKRRVYKLLALTDVRAALKDKQIHILWPEDGKWYAADIDEVGVPQGSGPRLERGCGVNGTQVGESRQAGLPTRRRLQRRMHNEQLEGRAQRSGCRPRWRGAGSPPPPPAAWHAHRSQGVGASWRQGRAYCSSALLHSGFVGASALISARAAVPTRIAAAAAAFASLPAPFTARCAWRCTRR